MTYASSLPAQLLTGNYPDEFNMLQRHIRLRRVRWQCETVQLA